MDRIREALFSTDAIRVCDPETPFWYTSGKLGPIYINTHFLYGGEQKANELLDEIEKAAASDRLLFPVKITEILWQQYQENPIFKFITDNLVENARKVKVDFISGGERRDFFFSILPAFLLKKPHLSIFKDGEAVYTDADFKKTIHADKVELEGKTSLHIVDLITEASSFTRSWLPVIRRFGAQMKYALTVVDRMQGGMLLLEKESVSGTALIEIKPELFYLAEERNIIDKDQLNLILNFIEKPDEFMPKFLDSHPDFIANQILLGGKNKERALLAIEKGNG